MSIWMLAVRPTDGRRNNEIHAAHLVSRAGLGLSWIIVTLNESKKAKAFLDTLSKANVYPIVYRLQTAKKRNPRMNMNNPPVVVTGGNRGIGFEIAANLPVAARKWS
jgi:hypothetical protein